MLYDVVIVGGGPGGLAAALTLGRARKRALLCDAGPRRNATAVHMHNFVTRDGTPPDEFRRAGREQLAPYTSIEVRDVGVESITGARGAFEVRLSSGTVQARRVLLCTGVIDELPEIEGFRALWGSAIFQCPYCHGWEAQDRRWGYLARAEHAEMFVPFVLGARGWTRDVVVFTDGAFEVSEAARTQLDAAGIRIETAKIARVVAKGSTLEAIELASGESVPRDVLFAHPRQRQVDLVRSLDLTYDEHGFVQTDPMKGETAVPGIYAAGDLATRMQAAVFAAAAGARVASMINLDVSMDLVARGEL